MNGTDAARGKGEGEGEGQCAPQMQHPSAPSRNDAQQQPMMDNACTTMCQQPVMHQKQQPAMYQQSQQQQQPMMYPQQLEIVSQPQQPVVVMNQQPIMMDQSAFRSTFLKEKEPEVFGCWKTKTFLKVMLGLTALWGAFWLIFSWGWMVPVGGGLCLFGALAGGYGMGKKSTTWLTVAQIIIGFGTCFLFSAPFVCLGARTSCKPYIGTETGKLFLVLGILTMIGYVFIWVITVNRYKKHISKAKRVTAPVHEDLARSSYALAWSGPDGHQAIRQ